jgi:hypothetical protein
MLAFALGLTAYLVIRWEHGQACNRRKNQRYALSSFSTTYPFLHFSTCIPYLSSIKYRAWTHAGIVIRVGLNRIYWSTLTGTAYEFRFWLVIGRPLWYLALWVVFLKEISIMVSNLPGLFSTRVQSRRYHLKPRELVQTLKVPPTYIHENDIRSYSEHITTLNLYTYLDT